MTPRINWKPNTKTLRQFGWTVFIGFGVIGALAFWKGHRPAAMGMWGGSAFVLTLALIAPVLVRPFYFIWMGFGLVMGSIMSRVMLTVIFYLVVTPVALFFKLIRRDELERKKTDRQTYWHDHPEISDPKYYEHLF